MPTNRFVYPITILIAAAILAAGLYFSRMQSDVMSVTGSAKQAVVADMAKLTLNWSRTPGLSDLRSGYVQMKQDENNIVAYLKKNGFTDADMRVSAVSLEEPNKYNPGAVQEYTLRQYVTINSNDITKIADLAKNVQPLVDLGILLAPQQPEYYYSKLADLRVSLLGEAVKDAEARAKIIAQSGHRNLGVLTTASMGVVQVLTPNSTDVSDYGSYDTSSQNKEVMITVRATFKVK
jgi:hypothetical protein